MVRGSRSARWSNGYSYSKASNRGEAPVHPSFEPRHHFGNGYPFGAVLVDRMLGIGVTEGNAEDQLAVRRQTEAATDQVRIRSQGGLGDRVHAKILCREHEVGDIQPAVQRAVNTEFLFGGDQRYVRRVEKAEVLQPLPL